MKQVKNPVCSRRLKKKEVEDSEVDVKLRAASGLIHSDLRVGANVASAPALRSNTGLSFMGVILVGGGFVVEPEDPLHGVNSPVIRKYMNGRDLTQKPRDCRVVDFFGLSDKQAMELYPKEFQRIFDRVKPERDSSRDKLFRDNWWLFGRARPDLREAIQNCSRYIGTTETAKHRTFVFIESDYLPDQKIRVVAHDDGYVLGVLSSASHVVWALAAGARLGVGNDPVYNNTVASSLSRFQLPRKNRKSEFAHWRRQLDAHRKKQQAQHPELTLTGMYSVLEKLKSGDALTAKEKTIHEQGLVSVLKQLHDELDLAVLDAYGWNRCLQEMMQVVKMA
ncbi:MAG: hypothetical protein R3E61_09310 [Pseudomonadales bacterium]